MLLATSGFGQDQYLSITNGPSEMDNPVIKTTRIRKNGQIDLVLRSKVITDDGQGSNLTKVQEVIDESESRNVELEEENKTYRAKRSIRNINQNSTNQNEDFNYEKNRMQDVIHAIYSLVILTIIYLVEMAFDRYIRDIIFFMTSSFPLFFNTFRLQSTDSKFQYSHFCIITL